MSQNPQNAKSRSKAYKKWALDLLMLIVVFYIMAILLMCFRDQVVLHPMQDESWKAMLPQLEKITGGKARQLRIGARDKKTKKEVQLHALYLQVPRSDRLILITHGNAGNLGHRVGLAAILAKIGSSVLVFDYQGYGESSGPARVDALIDNAEAAYHYAHDELKYPCDRIVLYGESIGCGVASDTATRLGALSLTPAAIILQSPFLSLTSCAKDKIFFLRLVPDSFFPPPALDNLAYVKSAHPPLLVIHGDRDQILPVQYGRTLFDEATKPKALYISEGQGHNDVGIADARLFVESVTGFLDFLDTSRQTQAR